MSEEFRNFKNNIEEIEVLIKSMRYLEYAKVDFEKASKDKRIGKNPEEFFKNKFKKLFDVILKSEIVLLNSYFEAYCKNKFVKILNKNPMLAIDFLRKKSIKPKLDFIYLGKYNFNLKDKMGDLFIDRQIVNFQDPQNYEQIFSDFFNITFFKNDEQREDFKKFSAIRNCIIHSANIPDTRYKKIIKVDKSPTELLSRYIIEIQSNQEFKRFYPTDEEYYSDEYLNKIYNELQTGNMPETSFKIYSDVLLELICDIAENIEKQLQSKFS